MIQTGGQMLGAAMSTRDPQWQAAAALADGAGSQLLVALPHSRKHESEADHMGLISMARAGYDPRQALEFWKRFAGATGGAEGPRFFRTHPVTADRIAPLQSLMPAALVEYERAQTPR